MHVIQVARQSLLCHIEDLQGKNRFYYTFVYASNNRHERKELWKDLYLHMRICRSQPWVIMGDMNVTFNIEEHSSGGSFVTEEMQEFRDCVNSIEVEDIGSSGSQAVFQPFLISDHSPAILIIPTCGIRKAKSFRFANYIVDKHGFINEVTEGWNVNINGHKMMRRSLWPKKARIDWLNKGDKNSAFYHKVIKGRRSRNRVHSICDDNGVNYEKEEVTKQFVKHFQQFLGVPSNTSEITLTNDLFNTVLSQEEADYMAREVFDKEIKDALFDIGDNKAPGLDGFSSVFFKKSWGVIGKDVCDAIKEFFSKGQMLGELNATLITLVLKIQNPQRVSNFRPIACCNVLYKCISKIVTNRIKNSLKKLVQGNQSAFIFGRLIQDNIMLSQELLRGYGRRVYIRDVL
ncbi:RNA-directed DNA polymerase, eukaryota, reverse transcriptase zinc-binding domain protein [Tanacetum coccineum]